MAREWRVCNLKWRSPSAPLQNPKMKHTRLTSDENGQVRPFCLTRVSKNSKNRIAWLAKALLFDSILHEIGPSSRDLALPRI